MDRTRGSTGPHNIADAQRIAEGAGRDTLDVLTVVSLLHGRLGEAVKTAAIEDFALSPYSVASGVTGVLGIMDADALVRPSCKALSNCLTKSDVPLSKPAISPPIHT